MNLDNLWLNAQILHIYGTFAYFQSPLRMGSSLRDVPLTHSGNKLIHLGYLLCVTNA